MSRVGQGAGALFHQQVEDGALILGRDGRQSGRLLADDGRDRLGVERVALATPTRSPTTGCGPSRIDFIDRLVLGNEELGQATPVAPCTLDAPAPLLSESRGPAEHRQPTLRTVGAMPVAESAPVVIQCHGHVDPFVRVDPNCDQQSPPLHWAALGLTGLCRVMIKLLLSQAR